MAKEINSKNLSLENLETKGITYKTSNSHNIVDNGNFKMVENLDSSDVVDRNLVKWKNYAYENGNFLQTPELMPQVL